jgi:hypothetical protein
MVIAEWIGAVPSSPRSRPTGLVVHAGACLRAVIKTYLLRLYAPGGLPANDHHGIDMRLGECSEPETILLVSNRPE